MSKIIGLAMQQALSEGNASDAEENSNDTPITSAAAVNDPCYVTRNTLDPSSTLTVFQQEPGTSDSGNNDAGISGLCNSDAVNNNEHYQSTLDDLLHIFTDKELSSKLKIQYILERSMKYLDTDSAAVASVMGNTLEIICCVGSLTETIQDGDKLKLQGTLCEQLLDSDEVVSIPAIEHSSYCRCNAPDDNTASYIGTQILSENGPLGTLSYFGNESKSTDFSEQDQKLVSLISNWFGLILGNEEKLEFLSHQNEYYRSLVQTVPTMMLLCNDDGLILTSSHFFSQTVNLESSVIPGRKCHSFFPERQHNRLSNALTAGSVNRLPLTLNCSNGTGLDVEFNSRIKSIGTMQGVRMIVLTDVTERNEAMREVQEQNKQLALINESLNQFAYVASHDLQEPLRKIMQFSVFLEEDLEEQLTDDTRYHLNVISNSATRMTTLIGDLLKFSQTAKGELVATSVDLNDIVGNVLNDLDLRIVENNATINIDTLPTVFGDQSLVQQLFANLIGNALKYHDKTRDPIITIRSSTHNDTNIIHVTDNGIGFEQNLAEKAFEPFNRLHSESTYTGNGIGLSICSTVCEKHGWSLSATSTVGQGSEFTIAIPLKDEISQTG